jgi:hypothetical protein
VPFGQKSFKSNTNYYLIISYVFDYICKISRRRRLGVLKRRIMFVIRPCIYDLEFCHLNGDYGTFVTLVA